MKIVLWRLGSLEHKIFPTQLEINKLRYELGNLSKDELNNMIWSPDLDVQVVDVEDLSELDHYILAYQPNKSTSDED